MECSPSPTSSTTATRREMSRPTRSASKAPSSGVLRATLCMSICGRAIWRHRRAIWRHRMADDHHHAPPTTPVEDRLNALEALLVEQGMLDAAAVDVVIEYYEHQIGPMNGAKVVARAWADPGYRRRLLADGTA